MTFTKVNVVKVSKKDQIKYKEEELMYFIDDRSVKELERIERRSRKVNKFRDNANLLH